MRSELRKDVIGTRRSVFSRSASDAPRRCSRCSILDVVRISPRRRGRIGSPTPRGSSRRDQAIRREHEICFAITHKATHGSISIRHRRASAPVQSARWLNIGPGSTTHRGTANDRGGARADRAHVRAHARRGDLFGAFAMNVASLRVQEKIEIRAQWIDDAPFEPAGRCAPARQHGAGARFVRADRGVRHRSTQCATAALRR